MLHVLTVFYLIYGWKKNKFNIKVIIYYLLGSIISQLIVFIYFWFSDEFINYIKGIYIYRYLYMIGAQERVFDENFIKLGLFRFGHIFWMIILGIASIFFYVKEKEKYQIFWIYLIFVSNIIIIILTGTRLFGHYFLYLVYGSVIAASYGIIKIIKYYQNNSPIIAKYIIFFLIIMITGQIIMNTIYLIGFNSNQSGNNYQTIKFDKDLYNYLNHEKRDSRILLLGDSLPYYYYLNRDMKEKFPIPGFFLLTPYKDIFWDDWFKKFKSNPHDLIVDNFQLKDTLSIEEFKEFVYQRYYIAQKINQYSIFRLREKY